MTDNTTVDIEDDLNAFSDEFFGTKAKAEEVEEEVEEQEEVDEIEDQSLATDEDEDEDLEDEDDNSDEEEEEVEEVPQIKKRNRAQERIEKLVSEARQAERERDALRIELERLRSETKEEVEQPKPVVKSLDEEAPKPDAVDDDGEPIYELGEFDPKYIRDLTRHTIAMETKAAKEAAEKEAALNAQQKAQDELTVSWNEKIDEYEKENPKVRENILELTDTFSNIDPGYGEFLAMTIMGLDEGARVMDYLAQNIDEAQRIVASGPVAATLSLGRLEARLAKNAPAEEKRNKKHVSEAPPPPENLERTRGRGGKFAVAPDTEDLDAFEREFFKARRF